MTRESKEKKIASLEKRASRLMGFKDHLKQSGDIQRALIAIFIWRRVKLSIMSLSI